MVRAPYKLPPVRSVNLLSAARPEKGRRAPRSRVCLNGPLLRSTQRGVLNIKKTSERLDQPVRAAVIGCGRGETVYALSVLLAHYGWWDRVASITGVDADPDSIGAAPSNVTWEFGHNSDPGAVLRKLAGIRGGALEVNGAHQVSLGRTVLDKISFVCADPFLDGFAEKVGQQDVVIIREGLLKKTSFQSTIESDLNTRLIAGAHRTVAQESRGGPDSSVFLSPFPPSVTV